MDNRMRTEEGPVKLIIMPLFRVRGAETKIKVSI